MSIKKSFLLVKICLEIPITLHEILNHFIWIEIRCLVRPVFSFSWILKRSWNNILWEMWRFVCLSHSVPLRPCPFPLKKSLKFRYLHKVVRYTSRETKIHSESRCCRCVALGKKTTISKPPFRVLLPPRSWFRAFVCSSTPRRPTNGYFLVKLIIGLTWWQF